MKILVVTPSFLPQVGGLQLAVHNLSTAWRRIGHEVLVANLLSDMPTHADANYNVKRLYPLRGGDRFGWHHFPWNIWIEKQISRIIASYNPDFITGHFAYPVGIWLARIDPAVPWTITCRAMDIQVSESDNYGYRLQFSVDKILGESLSKAGRVIVLSDNIRRIVSALGVAQGAIVKISNGADVRLRDEVSDRDINAYFNIPANGRYILSIGSNRHVKGFDTAIAAFSKILDMHRDTYYVFLGKDTGRLLRVADQYGVKDKIRQHEHLTGEYLRAAYQQAEVFLSSSRIEGFPLVLAEAVMAGLAIIATDCPGNREVVRTSHHGILCPVDDITAMANAMHLVLSDDGLRCRLSDFSRSHSDEYDWAAVAESYLSVYRSISE